MPIQRFAPMTKNFPTFDCDAHVTEPADVSYRIDREHDPTENLTIAHDDPDLAIRWPLAASLLSESDRAARPMAMLGDQLRRIAVIR